MNILFWNLYRKDNSKYIIKGLKEYDIDIALFCEYSGLDLEDLEDHISEKYDIIRGFGGCNRIFMISNKDISVNVMREASRYVIYSVSYNDKRYVFVGLHLQDKRNSDADIRIELIHSIIKDIEDCEKRIDSKNTVIIGDFNANPFDKELMQMNAFNSVFFRDVIMQNENRIVDERKYRRFYNPTIRFLSEKNKNYGSYYDISSSSTPVWHSLDQILVSKALVDKIKSIRYLRNISDVSLINKVRPNENISDHLPLLVHMEQL